MPIRVNGYLYTLPRARIIYYIFFHSACMCCAAFYLFIFLICHGGGSGTRATAIGGGGERKKQTVRTNRGRATVLNAENSLRMDMRRGGDLKSEHLTKNDTEPGSRLVVFRNDVDFERKKKKRPPNFQRIHTTTKWATITMKFELTNTRHKTSGNFEWLQNSLDKNGNINVRWNAFGS